MARTTMATLITSLRGMALAGSSDYTVNGLSYWTDNQLQDVLDAHRKDVYGYPLTAQPSYSGGVAVYLEYHSGIINLEQTDGGTAIFYITDGVGANVGTALYTADYNRGVITFLADTGGIDYELYGRTYDLNAAAADVWRQKAGQYATAVNFSTDNHRVDRGEIIKNCLKMAAFYTQQIGATNVIIMRGDNADRNY